MPVTFKTAPHGANTFNTNGMDIPGAKSPWDHLVQACGQESKQCREILQSSKRADNAVMLPSPNGFVRTVIRAYSCHHHLVIRPEDIWFAIISQLSLYINKHAEELRHKFVAHKDKKELVVRDGGNRWTVDHGKLAKRMTTEIEKNVVDPELAGWVMPNFSTTTDEDRIVGSVLFMGAMQSYFAYKFELSCGIPTVTLLGELEDWELLLSRLDKLRTLGDEPSQWFELLQPVLKRFVHSFKEPGSDKVVDFWQRVAHVEGMGSGPRYYAGWITAFCFWDVDGKVKSQIDKECLVLDGARYHRINSNDVPPGFSSVPVLIDDNGEEVPSMMIAGSVGIGFSSSGQQCEKGGRGLDTVQPAVGWWMLEKKSQDVLDQEAELEGQKTAEREAMVQAAQQRWENQKEKGKGRQARQARRCC